MDVPGGGRQRPGQSRREWERERAFFRPRDPAGRPPAVRPARSRLAARAQCACPAAAAEGGRFPRRPLPVGTSVGARLAKGRELRTALRSTSPAGGMLAGAALLLGLGLGLTLGVPLDSSAAGRSSAPSRDGRLPRASELGDATPEFYHRDGRVCKKCPPDEVELKPCTKTSDTQCACKNGTFCPPSLPCETCSKCTARCPEGEVMVRPCTPASDMQCEKSPTAAPPTASAPAGAAKAVAGALLGRESALSLLRVLGDLEPALGEAEFLRSPALWIWIFLGVLLTLLVLGGFVCKKKGRGGGPESRTTSCSSRVSRWPLLLLLRVRVGWARETAPLAHGTVLGAPGGGVALLGGFQALALRQSFEAFIKWVPLNAWKRFMRALGLTDNEIAIAELDEKGVTEQQFQMLRTWLDKRGKAAAPDALLDTLQAIGLQGVASTVRKELLSEGLYCLQANPPCTDS
ncbi:hypothetical protein lerEdw1_008778 [Lerista edwardsae]|nr:hypothetical protein lerEdw1_008778 [Lerista edwardsae]